MFYPYEGYRSVTPLDAARVNRTIFHNHSVHFFQKITQRKAILIFSAILAKRGNLNPDLNLDLHGSKKIAVLMLAPVFIVVLMYSRTYRNLHR